MSKRMVEIEDSLEETLDGCKEELLNDFKEYLKENLDISDFDQYYQAQGNDRATEIGDSSTPVYYSEINDTYYLHSDKLEEAYKNAGIYNEIPDNYKAVCICLYLQQELHEYMHNVLNNDFYEAFVEEKEKESKEALIKFINEWE